MMVESYGGCLPPHTVTYNTYTVGCQDCLFFKKSLIWSVF